MRNSLLLAGLGLVLLAAGLSFWAYPLLSDRVPTSWDLAGHVSGYSSRLVAVILGPSIVAFTWILAIVLPAISPRNYRLAGDGADAFYEAIIAVIATFVAMHFVLLHAEIAGIAPPAGVIFGLIGLLFAVIGLLIGRVSKNFFMGIRTPWTLANDEVWRRTNQLGGRFMVVGGLAIVAMSVFPVSWTVGPFVAIILLSALVPVVYSYVLYKRIEGFGSD
jgi:uncharacterized membrane protein